MGACCNREREGPADAGKKTDDPVDEPAIWKLGAGLLLAGNTMTVGLAISSVEAAADITLFIHIVLLASVVVVFELLGWPLLRGGFEGLRQWRINFDAFFLIAVVAAVGASLVSMATGGPVYFEVAALLLVIHGIGRRVGSRSRRRGLKAARSFAFDDMMVRRRGQDGGVETVDARHLQRGDRVMVGPGDTIAVDGRVVEGTALVRETEISGESFAAARRPGDQVYAGSHSLDGTLEIRTTAPPGGRLVDEVVESVEAAWQRPSRWQCQAQKAVQWFAPMVLAVAAMTFAGWTIAEGWMTGLFYALAVLLVACPCALGFAVPLAVWITTGGWAGRGLVAGDGQCVEGLSRVDTVVFDKTGTLTEPAPELIDFVVDGEAFDPRRVRRLVVAVEAEIDHPVARALSTLDQQSSSGCCAPSPVVESSRVIAGLGVEARVRLTGQSHRIHLGSTQLVDELDGVDSTDLRRLAAGAHRPGATRPVAVVIDGRVAAVGVIDETPRGWVAEGLEQLQKLGLEVGLMTGDAPQRARRYDVDWFGAKMTPVEKHDRVRDLQQRGRTVMFVGDGVNDAAAMATADVAINVCGGAELAGEVGDMQWTGRDLRTLPTAIAGAHRAFEVVRFNLTFATGYNAVGLGVAAAGLLHPVVAAVLMFSSSMFVTWKTTSALDSPPRPDADFGGEIGSWRLSN